MDPNRLSMLFKDRGPWQIVASILLVALIAVVARGVYNVYFHPLRQYPGPRLWAASSVPFAVLNIRGVLPFRILELHRKYGPVVRVTPDELVYSDARAWQDIYGLQQPGRRQNSKDRYAYSPPGPGFEKNIIHADDAFHARLRRIYGPAFTPKAVEDQGNMLLGYANLLVEQLKLAIEKNPVQDMSAWFNFTTFDLTGDLAFGEAFHCLEQGGKEHFFVRTVMSGVVTAMQLGQFERFGLFSLLKPFVPSSALKPKLDMDRYTEELVHRRMESGCDPNRSDVFNYLLQNKNEADQLEMSDLFENALTLVVAGSETTATLLSGATFMLCKNPAKLKQVQQEVREAFSSSIEITLERVNHLGYMIAVLSETMRVFPPAPFGIPRVITSAQEVAGRWVPEKTRCAIFQYAAYRDDRNFARPDEFIPERWLADADEEFKQDSRDVLQPMSFGPRVCLGKHLAYAEMRLLLAKFLWHFDFELADPDKDWYAGLKSYMVWERTSLNIRLKVRDKT